MITAKVKGFKNLEKNLKKLEMKNAKNLVRASLRAGGRVVVKKARANLPSNYVTLRKSLTVKVLRSRSPVYMDSQVGHTVGKKAKYNGWYGHIVEGGAAGHEIERVENKTKTYRGKKLKLGDNIFRERVMHPGFPARPYFRPAYDTSIKKIEEAYAEKMWSGIQKMLT